MKLDPDVRAAIKDIPAEYTIKKSKNHYFLYVDGHPRVLVAGNHGRLSFTELRSTLRDLAKLKERLGG